jgi:hypothetical protein
MKPIKRKLTSSLAVFLFLCAAQIASAFYDPYLGRWLNRDPIAERGGVNLYAFTGNSPIGHIDSYGNAWWQCTLTPGGDYTRGENPVLHVCEYRCDYNGVGGWFVPDVLVTIENRYCPSERNNIPACWPGFNRQGCSPPQSRFNGGPPCG